MWYQYSYSFAVHLLRLYIPTVYTYFVEHNLRFISYGRSFFCIGPLGVVSHFGSIIHIRCGMQPTNIPTVLCTTLIYGLQGFIQVLYTICLFSHFFLSFLHPYYFLVLVIWIIRQSALTNIPNIIVLWLILVSTLGNSTIV